MKEGYPIAVDRALPPAQVSLYQITTERVDLYCHVPPLGENIPVYFEPFLVEESVPMEDEIKWVVKKIHNHHSGGPSGMQVEQLKGWLVEARKGETAAAKVAATEGAT